MNKRFYVECDFCGKKEYVNNEADLFTKKKCFYCENELKRFNYYEDVIPSSINTLDVTSVIFDNNKNTTNIHTENNNQTQSTKSSESNFGCYLGLILVLGIIYYFGGLDGILITFKLLLFFAGIILLRLFFDFLSESKYGCLIVILIIAGFVGYNSYNEYNEEKQRQIVAEQRLKEAKKKEEEERLSLLPGIENRLSVLGYSGDTEEAYNQFCKDYQFKNTDDYKKRLSSLDDQIQRNKNIALVNDLIKDAKNKTGQKQWKRSSEVAKAEYWQKVYTDCINKGLGKDTFWQNFGSLVAKSFNPPFTKRLPSSNWRCPFSIKTTDANSMYYVKLTENRTGKVQTIFFKGYSFETAVPPGDYSFKYACGDTWYGPVFLFGPNGGYHKSSDILNFYNDGYHLCGHTVELIKQINGNFHTQDIDESDF